MDLDNLPTESNLKGITYGNLSSMCCNLSGEDDEVSIVNGEISIWTSGALGWVAGFTNREKTEGKLWWRTSKTGSVESKILTPSQIDHWKKKKAQRDAERLSAHSSPSPGSASPSFSEKLDKEKGQKEGTKEEKETLKTEEKVSSPPPAAPGDSLQKPKPVAVAEDPYAAAQKRRLALLLAEQKKEEEKAKTVAAIITANSLGFSGYKAEAGFEIDIIEKTRERIELTWGAENNTSLFCANLYFHKYRDNCITLFANGRILHESLVRE